MKLWLREFSPALAPDDGLDPSMGQTTGVESAGQGDGVAPGGESSTTVEITEGQAQGEAAGGIATPETPSIFEYEWEDGEKQRFGNTDELKDFFRGGVLRHKDYTKKAQEISEQRKAVEAERKRFENEYNSFQELKNQYTKYDRLISDLTPQEFERLVNEVRRARGGATNPVFQRMSQIEQMVKQRDEKDEQERQRTELEKRREKVYTDLAKELDGFSAEEVRKGIQSFSELPPGEEIREIAKLVHYAGIGRKRASEMARTLAGQNGGSSRVPAPPPSAGAVPVAPSGEPAISFRDAAERAKKKAGLAY